jgi:8-hydroxy-5-deazaflavin:NADPH oxidoreductase
MKKIGVIGSGAVGQVLAGGFLKHGYEVMLGSRDVTKLSDWKSKNTKGQTGTLQDTAKFGEIIVFCTKGTAAEDVLKNAGIDNFSGKTVIDVTNPIDNKPPENGVIKYFTSKDESLMERLQKLAPKANFVKAFNSVGNAFMVNPDFHGVKPTMFICGNNENASKEVADIVEKFGFEAEDLGKANSAGVIEQLCILWCIPGMLRNQWTHAFKLLKM